YEDFLGKAVPQVAKLLAEQLHAECVCIFFRRRGPKDLRRSALALNEDGHAKKVSDDECAWDFRYTRSSRTLLWEAYNKGQPLNYGPWQIDGLTEKFQRDIAQNFTNWLPSRVFRHLIIVPIYILDKQLGAVRVINHLNPAGWKPSQRE